VTSISFSVSKKEAVYCTRKRTAKTVVNSSTTYFKVAVIFFCCCFAPIVIVLVVTRPASYSRRCSHQLDIIKAVKVGDADVSNRPE